jgi:hypothetical protein
MSDVQVKLCRLAAAVPNPASKLKIQLSPGTFDMSDTKRQRPSSSSSSSSADVAALLECSICYNPFDESTRLPRMLPSCGHTFCAVCLARLVKQKTMRSKRTITCPNDSQESEVKGGDVASLPTNLTILPLITAALRPPVSAPPASASSAAICVGESCELCEEEQHNATHRCLECQQCMCEAVSKLHRRLSGTMSHRVVTVAEWRADPKIPSASASAAAASISHLCKSHGKAADLFDLDCGLFLCGTCVLSHVSHATSILPLNEAAKVCRAELNHWAKRVEHWDKRIAATGKACDQRGDEVQAAHGRAKDALLAREGQVCMCVCMCVRVCVCVSVRVGTYVCVRVFV